MFEPGNAPEDVVARAETLAFVKEGFSWPAFFFSWIWLIYHRMWIELACFIVVFLGLGEILPALKLSEATQSVVVFGALVFFALEANGLRRNMLLRRGYAVAGITHGRNREAAEFAFFRDWLPGHARVARPAGAGGKVSAAKAASVTTTRRTSAAPAPEHNEIIGSFPRA
ncbi:DUF2628 domain-containing protein [Methyloligella sp. 2.7D]|uniref:DUF2628 domain-containing protein n=1 Tax=unclassified Methyloligella TaxID=2625955 RepID=UPI00157DFD4C|nr:DUF2628 domain-containing protein [Methyloligella sp. GL2]QKP76287.1 DUF2628 domain-containing protein [Methyloligella sp. GL2]